VNWVETANSNISEFPFNQGGAAPRKSLAVITTQKGRWADGAAWPEGNAIKHYAR
jgi:hypothetical protein